MKKNSYEYVKNYIETNNYTLLSKTYYNNKMPLSVKCPKNHIFEIRFNSFYSGRRCPVCFGTSKHTLEYVRNLLKNDGFTLLSDNYISNKKDILIKCPVGHIYKTSFHSYQQGDRCLQCFLDRNFSQEEKNILKYVETIYDGTILPNNRSVVKNNITGRMLELDIFLPEINKAIEYNGSYWHSSNYSKYKDKQKVLQCKEKGIDLLVINDDDYIKNKQQELNKISFFIKG
jgi:hypothetical protein